MNIESITTTENAIEFAKEEFVRRNMNWDSYELDGVIEYTDEVITKLKSKNKQPRWDVNFMVKVSEGFEARYLFLHVYPSLGTCEIIQHC